MMDEGAVDYATSESSQSSSIVPPFIPVWPSEPISRSNTFIIEESYFTYC